jgi:hypothetical protein
MDYWDVVNLKKSKNDAYLLVNIIVWSWLKLDYLLLFIEPQRLVNNELIVGHTDVFQV